LCCWGIGVATQAYLGAISKMHIKNNQTTMFLKPLW